MINDRKTQDEWKIQLTTAINFMSSKDSTETCTIHCTSDNIEITIGSETDEIIEELFESHIQKYQKGLEQSTKGSGFHCVKNVDIRSYSDPNFPAFEFSPYSVRMRENKDQLTPNTDTFYAMFVFDSTDLLHCQCHKISLNHSGSYIDSLKWLKKQKSNNKF